MAFSHDVKLAKELRPIWPQRCVGCLTEEGIRPRSIRTSSITLLSTLTMSFGKKFSVDIPACQGCGGRIAARRWGSFGLSLGLMSATAWGFGFYGDLDGLLNKVLLVLALLASQLPIWAYDLLRPPAIDLTAYSSSVAYEFRDQEYAREFAQLNDANVD